ncbi:patatin-like phospholipase family protein [Vogesella mureinivorans]|uniref:patatin-like phospholipase family protein n=1 Tax=Vogesella mureinivorans TaxID=657276 RepID=UPI0011CA4A49|nr:patatin-like phospholipase family protein [Vogesella mureinivorans]
MDKPIVGLVLAGGGARAAYQVGVLMAVAHMLPRDHGNPFPIISGTSAGAINAVGLAAGSMHFRRATAFLAKMWKGLHVSQVYRADWPYFARAFLAWGGSVLTGGKLVHNPASLLDNSPLRELLSQAVNFDGVSRAVQSGDLRALSLTASCYTTGQSVSFFEGRDDIDEWHRYQRLGVRESIGVDHLMATSAIPMVFPAATINGRFYCDGAIRQMAPLSPALHLGAEKLFVINLNTEHRPRSERRLAGDRPSLAMVFGHLLNSIFFDSMATDMERLSRVNHTISLLDEQVRCSGRTALKRVEVLNISPSVSLEAIAFKHVKKFPPAMRFLMRGAGAMRQRGSVLASYLLFDPAYGKELIDLGYKDAMARQDEILNFLQKT